ncbi:uncharacterized protein L969DRAFT_91336 [Mixia osmundae IAM 14324]|uniref:Geranylgeranyl transferase type-2 subunit beta n=1 Tax=Mixia osmundae (strain CBS 9802 / IAM 14324 / JCM 22182 / KY 12970) TaxID=764103 RepID=G7E4K1_MIXOS|nr:uncharacterized protein L969DRAFT_91336 [Mixia osmundae IAM 14324]KEI41858.1 hypothetical protein L969DRAFT_91336 [Mixia osmundae IAM 14324]GAA97761.1 hypothetical protein E5Q_04440 [Mixia osmundae IAM 14324]
MDPEGKLMVELHVKYIQSLDQRRNELAYHLTEHLRMNGIYWGLTALAFLNRKDALPRQDMLDWVMACWDDKTGGFRPHPGHDVNVHCTLSAVQIIATHDALHILTPHHVELIVQYILSLQDEVTGSFAGDEWGEVNTRFSYCAVSTLALLNQLHRLDKQKTASWIERCRNFDGGFGMTEGAESHAAYVWTCVGALAILGRLDIVDRDTLSWWLCERQLPNGGLNGRPEKLEDVCYSWWVIATLAILDRTDWVNGDKLSRFILSCQDTDDGGIADRPEDVADVWHTVFGIAGLSLLGHPGLAKVDPVFCMPRAVTIKTSQT